MSKVKETLVVRQTEEAPVTKEVLAEAIVSISKAFKQLQKSGLNRKAIIILVSHSSGQYQNCVCRVLDSLESLAKDYCA